jgi:hypothetical protein
MDNPGTSINFDANALYADEENEREFEDKQQQNELKELLTNAFDDILDMDDDDDEDSSSSDFSLYGNANNHQNNHHKKIVTNTRTVLTTNNNNGVKSYHHQQQQQQQKIIYQQQYSTPAINQLPPPPLQLNINEQTINYEHHYNIKEEDDDDDDDDEQPRELIHPTPQLHQKQQQKQHDIDQQQQQDMHHLHIGNDHHLNHDEDDDEDDDDIDESKFQFGNGLQLELNQQTPKNPNYNLNSNGLEMNNVVDNNDDEENFDDLNINQFEFMNIDSINRQYGRLQLLYKVRGKKLEEVTNRFEAFKEDVNREIRAMKHRLSMADKEKEQAQLSLEQSKELCQQYNMEIQILNKQNQEIKIDFDKIKEINENLHVKLQETNDEIESLNYQIEKQQNLDSIERLKVQHEQILTQIREKYEHEMFLSNENLNKYELELNEQHQLCDLLRSQLDQSLKQSDQALIERGDTINRLNKRLLELQKQYDDLLILRNLNSNEVSQTNLKLYERITYLENMNQDREKYFQQLQDRNKDLEEQVKLNEAMHLCQQQQQQQNVSDSTEFNTTANESVITLKKELERSLNLLKVKRNDIQKYQNEIQKLKDQVVKSPPVQQSNLGCLNVSQQQNFIDELNKEKMELQSDLTDLKLRLEESYQHSDGVAQHKQDLENEIYNKNEQIEHLSNELTRLREETNVAFIEDRLKIVFNSEKVELVNKYELNIQCLKLDLDNLNVEVSKLKQLYVDVCNEKNDIEDRLRNCHDKELKQLMFDYELKMKKMDEKYLNLEKNYENDKINFKNDIEKNYQDSKLSEKNLVEEINVLKIERKKLEGDFKNDVDILTKEKFSFIEKISSLENESKILKTNEIDCLNFKIKNYENQIENFKNEKFNLIERISNLEKEAEKVKKLPVYENEIENLNKKVKCFEADVLKIEKEKFLMSEKLAGLEKDNDGYKKLCSDQTEVEILKKKVEKYEFDIELLNKTYLNEKMVLIKQENEKYTSLENDNSKLVQKFDTLKSDYDNLNAKYKNEYNQLKNQNDEVNKKFSKELETKLNEVFFVCTFEINKSRA